MGALREQLGAAPTPKPLLGKGDEHPARRAGRPRGLRWPHARGCRVTPRQWAPGVAAVVGDSTVAPNSTLAPLALLRCPMGPVDPIGLGILDLSQG